MAARALASVTVTFGMVSIPVKLYTATQAQAGVSFNLLHAACGSRLKQQYLCAREGVVVERADMVKGYEFAKDQYVTFTPEELKELEEKGTQTIEISEFVPAESIDPIYYDKAYFLGPDKGGAKPYALLAESMRQTKPDRGRALRRARQAVHRSVARRTRRPGHAAAAVRAGSPRHRRHRDRGSTGARHRARIGEAAHRADFVEAVRSERIRGRRKEAHRGGGAEKGRGRGDRRCRPARRKRAPRSST